MCTRRWNNNPSFCTDFDAKFPVSSNDCWLLIYMYVAVAQRCPCFLLSPQFSISLNPCTLEKTTLLANPSYKIMSIYKEDFLPPKSIKTYRAVLSCECTNQCLWRCPRSSCYVLCEIFQDSLIILTFGRSETQIHRCHMCMCKLNPPDKCPVIL